VSSAGDVNGDGFDDIIIGAFGGNVNAPYCGASYVILGKAAISPAEITLNSTNSIKINGGGSGDRSGSAVGTAGDVNGDGFDDLIIGAPKADSKGALSGSSYVVFGGVHAPVKNLNLSTLTGKNGFQLRGAAAGDESGKAVASAGDVNADGFDDVIVGSPRAKNGNLLSAGASYVVFGQATGPITRVGTGADEFFAGGKFIDNLSGAGGNDRLLGNGGKDILNGGVGGDLLTGGLNGDRLTGGVGGDRFIYLLKTDSVPSDPDTVLDFKSAEGDRIDLAGVDAIQATSPNNAFTFIGSQVFHGKAGELRFSGGILAGDTDGNKVADISVKLHVTGSFGAAQIVK
jgi:Ca2+-binding RTX toxin-like protein